MKNETGTSIGLAVVLAFAIVFGLILTKQSTSYDVEPSSKPSDSERIAGSSESSAKPNRFSEPAAREREEGGSSPASVARTSDPAPRAVAEAPAAPTQMPSAGSSRTAPAAGQKQHEAERPIAPSSKNADTGAVSPSAAPKLQIPAPLPPAKPAPEPKPAKPAPVVPSDPSENTDRIALGEPLQEPAVAVARSEDSNPGGGYYVVRPNDNLVKICKAVYGTTDRQTVRALFEANKDTLKSMNLVKVGQRLRIPQGGTVSLRGGKTSGVTKPLARAQSPPSGAAAVSHAVLDRRRSSRSADDRMPVARASASSSTYRWCRVRRNETLCDIAQRELGNSRRWREIWELNRSRIRRPDRLAIGMRIKLPPSMERTGTVAMAGGQDAPDSKNS